MASTFDPSPLASRIAADAEIRDRDPGFGVLYTALESNSEGLTVRRYHLLALERNKVTFFPLSWTIVHPIDDHSPLAVDVSRLHDVVRLQPDTTERE